MSMSSKPPEPARARRLLLIDDDPILREFAQIHLAAADLTVVTAGSAQAAMEQMKQSGFDIVVTDFDMPGMNGLELIGALRADSRYKSLPIIFATGSDDLATVNAAYRLGIANFAAKPINWKILAMQIRNAL